MASAAVVALAAAVAAAALVVVAVLEAVEGVEVTEAVVSGVGAADVDVAEVDVVSWWRLLCVLCGWYSSTYLCLVQSG